MPTIFPEECSASGPFRVVVVDAKPSGQEDEIAIKPRSDVRRSCFVPVVGVFTTLFEKEVPYRNAVQVE